MGRKPTKHLNLPPKMRARKQRSGTVYYYYEVGGSPRKEIPLGSDFIEAVRQWSGLEVEAKPRHMAIVTFRYAAERYVREVIPNKAPCTQTDNLRELTKLYEFFDNPPAPLADIQPLHIRQYLDWRVKEAQARLHKQNKPVKGTEGQIRANREKALFSHIWNKAREWGLTDQSNPCAGVRNYRERGRVNVYIDDVAYRAVWEAADPSTRDAMDLAYLTGQRPADTLKFDERDIREGALWIQQNKTRKKLRIVLEGQLAIVIERIRARKRAYRVISTALIVNEKGQPLTYAALNDRFEKARAAANIPKEAFQFRDIRAKAATDTGDLSHAQKLLGHASRSMTEHYTRERIGEKVKPTR